MLTSRDLGPEPGSTPVRLREAPASEKLPIHRPMRSWLHAAKRKPDATGAV